ncbi:MAG: hypothetical protein KGJ86_11895, partial [Chloroflexota bacterium]|nr:hypothetical protein [Chloroflexota bacterium]
AEEAVVSEALTVVLPTWPDAAELPLAAWAVPRLLTATLNERLTALPDEFAACCITALCCDMTLVFATTPCAEAPPLWAEEELLMLTPPAGVGDGATSSSAALVPLAEGLAVGAVAPGVTVADEVGEVCGPGVGLAAAEDATAEGEDG